MRFQGPIYRPPSEADSLLVQATVGCPHNTCTFCMVYKNGPPYMVRPIKEIVEDLQAAAHQYGSHVRSLFLPSGNSLAMPAEALAEVCQAARQLFPLLERITVYGSAASVLAKGEAGLNRLAESGLSRVHIGLESGCDRVLRRIRKGAGRTKQIEAGVLLRSCGIENHTYVMLGIGGRELSREHAKDTATAVNVIQPDCLRIRTFLPKVNTPLLEQIELGQFEMVTPHEALAELKRMVNDIEVETRIASDHYTNYLDVQGRLPQDRSRLMAVIDTGLARDASSFRPVYVGTQ